MLPEEMQSLAIDNKVDTIYCSPDNAEKAKRDIIWSTSYVVEANSKTLPGTSSFTIPNVSVVDYVMLNLKLADIPSTVTSNHVGVCAGWGYNLIDTVRYRLGSSPQYILNTQQIIMLLQSQLENQDKQMAELLLAGPLSSVSTGGLTNATSASVSASVILPLPFLRNGRAGMCDKPIDLSLLNNSNLYVDVYWKSLTNIVQGSNQTDINTYINTTCANQLTNCTMVARLGNFINKDDSLKVDLLANPQLEYRQYCHIAANNYVSNAFTLDTSTNKMNLTLQGFRSGSLDSIQFMVLKDSDQSIGDPQLCTTPPSTTGGVINKLRAYRLKDIRVTYNGQIYYQQPGEYGAILESMLHTSSSGSQIPVPIYYVGSTTTTDLTKNSTYSLPYYSINFSQFAISEIPSSFQQTGLQPAQNTILIEAYLADSVANFYNEGANGPYPTCLGTSPPTNNTDFRLYASYIYDAAVVIGSGGTRVDFIF